MKFDDMWHIIEGIPYITERKALSLYNFVINNTPRDCLELGFAHGVSVCCVAAALDEIGEGHITAVDLVSGKDWQKPSIEDLLKKLELESYCTIAREAVSYTWFLRKKIELCTQDYNCKEIYDFAYIDGAKNWTVDGAAFFMVDKLIRKNGFILFDDINWVYSDASDWDIEQLEKSGITVSTMENDEISEPHIRSVFELLVMQHPDYSKFIFEDQDWGWAQKIHSSEKTVNVRESWNSKILIKRLLKRSGM